MIEMEFKKFIDKTNARLHIIPNLPTFAGVTRMSRCEPDTLIHMLSDKQTYVLTIFDIFL